MDINDLRALLTVLTFAGFIGVWIWAWNKRRVTDFEESADLPLQEDRYIDTDSRGNA